MLRGRLKAEGIADLRKRFRHGFDVIRIEGVTLRKKWGDRHDPPQRPSCVCFHLRGAPCKERVPVVDCMNLPLPGTRRQDVNYVPEGP